MTKEECCELCVNTIGCDFSVLAGPNKPQPGQCFLKQMARYHFIVR